MFKNQKLSKLLLTTVISLAGLIGTEKAQAAFIGAASDYNLFVLQNWRQELKK